MPRINRLECVFAILNVHIGVEDASAVEFRGERLLSRSVVKESAFQNLTIEDLNKSHPD